ncbi:hypothetical protein PHBOTO_006006 [Pseudozyma hubeiensis]|nr:hypothetical protein PHBOTO_006006 [Pseudozyma hubeiensis]
MAEPPFQMPGHRWDPDKKRFFKILPGQIQSNSSDGDTASGSASKSSRKGKGKQREASPHEHELFSNTCLPTIDVRTPAQKLSSFKSAFHEATVDPVTLRQHGRLPLTSRQISAQPRIEATYSHLALCTARRPFRHYDFLNLTGVVGLLTDPDGCSLIQIDSGFIGRSFPESNRLHLCDVPQQGQTQASFVWRSSDLIWSGGFDSEGQQKGIFVKKLSPRVMFDHTASRPEHMQSRFLEHDAPIRSFGHQAWAFVEIFGIPCNAGSACDHSHTVSAMGGRGSSVVYALSTGKQVKIHTYHLPIAGEDPSLAASVTISSASDIMTLAFDLSGGSLYCGTRSGLVTVWRRPASSSAVGPPPHVMPIDAEGSVTNLAVVSATELLIVRINGTVQLVDMATGEIRQRYRGHVNSYHYKLAITIDRRTRMLALAGLDRRIRVWSLDSPLPLGTRATYLPPIYHSWEILGEGQQIQSFPLYDESKEKSFLKAHRASEGNLEIKKGLTLSSVVFPQDPTALHWHPRYSLEGISSYEVVAIGQGQGHRSWLPKSQWNDLYVAMEEWVYQFRFP